MEETTAPQKAKKPKKAFSPALNAAIITIAFVLIVGLILLLLNGKTTVTNSGMSDQKSDSVTCISNSPAYKKLTVSSDVRQELQYNLIFRADKIDTIGMVYTLYYDNADSVSRAESIYRAELNKAIAASGYSDVTTFNNKFNQFNDRLTLSLFVSANQINGAAAPYFMILTDDDGNLIPSTKSDYIKNYENQGFSCKEVD